MKISILIYLLRPLENCCYMAMERNNSHFSHAIYNLLLF